MSRYRVFRGGSGRRYWALGATLAALAAFAIVFVAASGAALSDSPFEGADGNMIVNTSGHTDWCTDFPAPASGSACTTPIAGLRTLTDVASGTTDNSFTQGSKEDNPAVTIAQGSIPPNKNDLTRAYAATQPIGNDTFLYLAWERQPNPNGSANIDFELDQNATPGADWFSNGASFTINRTEGDVLITYDFGGSGTPDLGLLTWLTAGHGHSNSDCQANGQTLPCWGNRVDVNPGSTPAGEAGVNASTIDEVLAGGQLDAGSFGEAKIDLSAIPGLFTPDTCKAFGNMFVKSRSSGSSIDAELKDFIAPVPVQVTNCPTPTIATQTSVDAMTVGDTQTVGDTATLSGGNNPTGDVSFQLYSDANCQNAVSGVSGTAPLDQNGVATFSGVDFTPDHTGTYYWGVSYAGDDHNNPASACGGDNEEIVVGPASPGVTTVADPSSVVVGSDASGSVSDTATFTDGFQLDGQNATFTLYSDAGCSNATSVSGSAPISGGSATFTGDASGLGVGTYYWGVSYAGDANNNPISECGGDEGVQNEVLSIEKASPGVTTVADPSDVVVGSEGAGSVSDTATFTGGYQLQGDSVDFTLYSDAGCSNATSVSGPALIDNSQATFTGDASSLPAGTYYWGVSFAGDDSNNPVSECGGDEGVQNEVLTIEPASPQVTTVADPSAAPVGAEALQTASDTATFTGGFGLDGQAVTFTLYRDPSCDPADATSVFGTAEIQNNQATFSGDASGLPAGTYYWGVSYDGDTNNNPVSECGGDEGVQNEVLQIGPVTPSVATTLKNAANDSTVENGSTLPHGSSIYDTASITNTAGFPLTGTVTFRFFHNGTCSGDPASTQTGVAVGGHSSATGPLDAGSYAFQAMYVAGEDSNHTDSAWSACEPFNIQPLVDLQVTKAGSPAEQTLGDGNITWTIVVKNNGPDSDTGVTISDPMPAGNTFVSVTTTKGSCTGGASLNCTIGDMAAGETVTITLVTHPTAAGTIVNTVMVSGNAPESNTSNNTATASVVVKGFTPPPVYCVAVSKITPKQLFVGRKTGLTIHLTKNKQAAKGYRVKIKGAKLNITTKPSNAKGIVKQTIKAKKAGILTFTPIASKKCNTKRVGITGVFTPPVTG